MALVGQQRGGGLQPGRMGARWPLARGDVAWGGVGLRGTQLGDARDIPSHHWRRCANGMARRGTPERVVRDHKNRDAHGCMRGVRGQ